ncbi:helix-hairpin-helix domain-containing protein [Halosegnis sp.]|uniref:helix-hairpin-helix domain-containing protein n=1 Tax=Halosegnis sp. TaxID=2864959 RepID=UPI0035D484D2
MTTASTPIDAFVRLQQTAAEQTQATLVAGLEAGQTLSRAAINQRYEDARAFADAYLDALETVSSGEELTDLRRLVVDQFDAAEQTQQDAFDTLAAALDVDGAKPTFDEDLEFAAIDEEFAAGRNALAETVAANLEMLEVQTSALLEELATIPDSTEATADSVAPGSAEATVADDAEPVETVDGIGPTYAGRLAEHGIESVGALAAATPATIAEAADVSETRAAGWIETARQ